MNASKNKPVVMVTSIPKSGTHLLIPVLESLGFSNTHCFVVQPSIVLKETSNKFTANRQAGFYFSEGNPFFYENKIDIDFPVFMKLRSSGDFFLSHLTPRSFPFYLLSTVKVVLIKRNLIKSLMSDFRTEFLIQNHYNKPDFLKKNNLAYVSVMKKHMRGVMEFEKPQQRFYKFLENILLTRRPHHLDLLYWKYYKNVHFLNFEDLTNSETNGKAVAGLANFLGSDVSADESEKIIHQALNTETPTKVPDELRKAAGDIVWDARCQRIYEKNMMHLIQDELDSLTNT